VAALVAVGALVGDPGEAPPHSLPSPLPFLLTAVTAGAVVSNATGGGPAAQAGPRCKVDVAFPWREAERAACALTHIIRAPAAAGDPLPLIQALLPVEGLAKEVRGVAYCVLEL
jgi:hypothetical protein